jgi:uncharacterized cupin superfamily protein
MTDRRHPNVANAEDAERYELKKGKHHVVGRRLGAAAGSVQLGATLTELVPGAISFPFHYHCNNEEAVYVVSGTGTARLGDARVKVRAGDWIAYPIGPAHAHQIINDGDAPLVYLCVSTMHKCEVVGYPDSKKLASRAGESFDKPWIRTITRDQQLDYWDGEPEA